MWDISMNRFYFLSNWGPGWAGCEELWSRAATALAGDGHIVFASVPGSLPLHENILALRRFGIKLHVRRPTTIWTRLLRRLRLAPAEWQAEVARIASVRPDLVIVSDGGTWSPTPLLTALHAARLSFATLAQCNSDRNWLAEECRAQLAALMAKATTAFFVSRANLQLAEYQLGCKLPNAQIVSNPWTVDPQSCVPWPGVSAESCLKMACVARLHPDSKGQDLLLLALSSASWKERNWELTFFGDGPQRGALQLMAKKLGLANRVAFAGHVRNIADIWRTHHVLTLASRYEGMPLALLEALICGRPALVTAVAGNPEVVSEGQNGFVASAPNLASVEATLERLWESRSRLKEMGEQARLEMLAKHPIPPERTFADELMTICNSRPG
jgi:glycosyltransferase involved in cell wall biosynthesis